MCKKIIFISIGLIITDQIIKKIMLNKQIEILKNIFHDAQYNIFYTNCQVVYESFYFFYFSSRKIIFYNYACKKFITK